MANVKGLKTIDAETAQAIRDRLYFTVRMNLVDRKQRDNWVKDQRAREIAEELVRRLDGLMIHCPPQPMSHGDPRNRETPWDDLLERVYRAALARPHQVPIMNARPAIPALPTAR